MVAANGIRNFTQIIAAVIRDDQVFFLRLGESFIARFPVHAAFLVDGRNERCEQGIGAFVVELACDRAVDRHVIQIVIPQEMAALVLFLHLAQCIFRPFALVFIDDNQIGVIDHVDFFELCRRAEFTGHDVHRHIGNAGDLCIALPDAARFHDDQVESCRSYDIEDVADRSG